MEKEDQAKTKAFHEQPFWIWWKRYGDHLMAPLILIALVILAHGLYQDNQLQKEVSVNCGWGEEDYQCYCAKSEALKIKNLMEGQGLLAVMNYTYEIDGAGIEKAQGELANYLHNTSQTELDKMQRVTLKNNSE